MKRNATVGNSTDELTRCWQAVEAAATDEERLSPLRYVAQAALHQGDAAGAARACRRILALRPRDLPAACLLQDAWAALGALIQIERVADAFVDHESPMAAPDAAATFVLARGRFRQLYPDFPDAEQRQTLRQGLGTLSHGAPQPETVEFMFGVLYLWDGQTKAAVDCLRVAAERLRSEPAGLLPRPAPWDLASALLWLARAQWLSGDVDGALLTLEEAVLQDPTAMEPREQRIYLLSIADRDQEAQLEVERLSEIPGGEASAALGAGLLLWRADRPEDARSVLEEGVPDDRRDARFWFVLGRVHAAAGAQRSAVDALRRAVALMRDGYRPWAWVDEEQVQLNLGRALLALDPPDLHGARRALRQTHRFLKQRPNRDLEALLWADVAELELKAGRLDAARHASLRLAEAQPGSAIAATVQGEVFFQQSDPSSPDRAIAEWEHAGDEDDDPTLRVFLADAREKRASLSRPRERPTLLSDAARDLEAALALLPANAAGDRCRVEQALTRVLRRAGELEAAAIFAATAWRRAPDGSERSRRLAREWLETLRDAGGSAQTLEALSEVAEAGVVAVSAADCRKAVDALDSGEAVDAVGERWPALRPYLVPPALPGARGFLAVTADEESVACAPVQAMVASPWARRSRVLGRGSETRAFCALLDGLLERRGAVHRVDLALLGDARPTLDGVSFPLALAALCAARGVPLPTGVAGTGSVDMIGRLELRCDVVDLLHACREWGVHTLLLPVDAPLACGEPVPSGLRVVRVATVDEAFAALTEGRDGRWPLTDDRL